MAIEYGVMVGNGARLPTIQKDGVSRMRITTKILLGALALLLMVVVISIAMNSNASATTYVWSPVGASSASVAASWNPVGVPINGDTVTFSTGSYQDCTWDISPYLVNFNYLGGAAATRSSVITLTNNLRVNGTLTIQSAHATNTCTLTGVTYQVSSYGNTIVSTRGIYTQGTGTARLGNCTLSGGTITQAGPIYFYSLIMSSGTLTGSATQNCYIIDGSYQKTGGTVGTNLRVFFISSKYIAYYNNLTTYTNDTSYSNETSYTNETIGGGELDYSLLIIVVVVLSLITLVGVFERKALLFAGMIWIFVAIVFMYDYGDMIMLVGTGVGMFLTAVGVGEWFE